MAPNFRSALVTGGGGFVGAALCRRLRQMGVEVTSVARGDYPQLQSIGVRCIKLDLAGNISALGEVLQKSDVVFHTAAKVDMWGAAQEFYRANVIATQNILSLARLAGVKRFVFTSSPSVVADGNDLEGIDESYPYPGCYLAHYPATKAIAERMVLKANCQDFLTLALRPHLIFGPGDRHLIPTIISRARSGRLPQVGTGNNRVDVCFIEDCVAAHICAAEALLLNAEAAGRAYFVSQGEPVFLWQWIGDILQQSGLAAIERKLPRAFASSLARLCEFISAHLPWQQEPLLTQFLVKEMSTSHYFNISAARKYLNWSPKYSVKEALGITLAAGSHV